MRKRCLFDLVVVLVVLWSAGVLWAGDADLPCVMGETLSAGQAAVLGAGFSNQSSNSAFSDTVASGIVSGESPVCGSLYDTGTPVVLTVSLGSLASAGASYFGVAFNGVLFMFALGLFFGLFVKLTNRS